MTSTVSLPGRPPSIGARTERAITVLLDEAHQAFTDAASAPNVHVWAAQVGYGLGLLAAGPAVDTFHRPITGPDMDRLYTARFGRLPHETYTDGRCACGGPGLCATTAVERLCPACCPHLTCKIEAA